MEQRQRVMMGNSRDKASGADFNPIPHSSFTCSGQEENVEENG